MSTRNLDKLMAPGSIVAIGASSRPRSVGAAVTRNLLGGGFAGEIHLVNRKGGEISGRAVLKSLAEVPGAPDLAVVMTPAGAVPGSVHEMGAKGTKAAVIISGGPGAGAEGRVDIERWGR
jgi:acetyltransferase